MMKKYMAEFIGTFILVFGGCGSAVFAAGIENIGIGLLGVSLAFGLTVVGCAYALGGVSGCHLNPAVTVGLTTAGRFDTKDVPGYILSQVAGSIVAAGYFYSCCRTGRVDMIRPRRDSPRTAMASIHPRNTPLRQVSCRRSY